MLSVGASHPRLLCPVQALVNESMVGLLRHCSQKIAFTLPKERLFEKGCENIKRSGAERANDILEDSLLGIKQPMCNNDLPESGVAKAVTG